jgi:hypothetical protein
MRLLFIGLSAIAVIAADFTGETPQILSGANAWIERIEMRLSPPQSESVPIPAFEMNRRDSSPDATPTAPPQEPPIPSRGYLPLTPDLWGDSRYAALSGNRFRLMDIAERTV